MTAAHSYWSASGFESVMLCPGKKVMEAGAPDSTSIYAAEGTAAHQLLTWALTEKVSAAFYLGEAIGINERGRVIPRGSHEVPEWTFMVDDEMARHVQVCIDYVLDLAGPDGSVIVDTKVNYSKYLGVEFDSAWGTADVIILRGDEIIVVDFKYGMGVEVSAEKNPQMSLYALGALAEYEDFGDFQRVRMAISQPRITVKPSEYDTRIVDLVAWAQDEAQAAVIRCEKARTAGGRVEFQQYLTPGEKQCKFCRAKATCSAYRAEVAASVGAAEPATPEEFAALEPVAADASSEPQWLAASLTKCDLIEDWCKAVRAEAERRLLAGEAVPGFKIVQGKRGARQWSDAKEVEATLKSMRIKIEDMYDFKLISPTSAEKLAKSEVIGKRQWPKLQAMITQSEGKPHVAPDSDPRPALQIQPVADEFASLEDFA